MQTSPLQHGLFAHDSDEHSRRAIRKRSLTTVKDPFTLVSVFTRENGRAAIRELNESIGMCAYEIVTYRVIQKELVEAEVIVPGRDLAMLLKLKYGGS